MVRAPTPEEEDRRRLCRELGILVGERVRHADRVRGVLFAQGVAEDDPRRPDRRARLEALRAGDGRPPPRHLKAMIARELDLLDLLDAQVDQVRGPA